MEEKKHVGRPTNEEVASRKKKKVIKYSLITIVSILLVGGIALFLNRDNIDFSSLMGASIFKREKYVVNSWCGPDRENQNCFSMSLKDKKEYSLYSVSDCKVTSGSSRASCGIYNSVDGSDCGIKITAKKKGNVSFKVTGKNKKGKTVSKTVRIKIGSDFKSPTCKISTPSISVRRGTNIEATLTCNENITFTGEGKKYNNTAGFSTMYKSVLKNQKCETFNYYYSYIQRVEKINNKSFKLYYHIPEDACLSKDLRLIVFNNTFKDSNGNMNIGQLMSNPISIIK